MKNANFRLESRTSKDRLKNREKLYKLFKKRPMLDEELLVNLGLFMRSSALTKLLYLNELYQRILKIPGIIIEYGVWWGQNLAVFENLRAIYEPFNYNRRIIGFDTFTGYKVLSAKDKKSKTIKAGSYKVSKNYESYLKKLIDYHERENVLFYKNKHKIIKGNVVKTLPVFLKNQPETVIALAYLDLSLYKPTKLVLREIKPHLIKGSVVAIDGLNSPDYPGETIALKEAWGLTKLKFYKSKFMPGRSYIVVD